LAYHEVNRENFARHVKYLIDRDFQIISMDEILLYLHQKALPGRKVIAITFDDGWKSNYSEVFPVVKQYQIPVIIYVVSKTLISDFKPWFFIAAELKSSGIREIPDESESADLGDEVKNRMFQELKKRHESQLKRSHTLCLDDVLEMQQSGLVTLGSHTCTHVNLNQIPLSTASREIRDSKNELESVLNKPVDHFAYPKGFYNKMHFGALRSAGYRSAVTIIPGFNNISKNNSFEMRRIFLSAKDDVSILSAKLSGMWHRLHKIKINDA
jgi:peptidoglycan/xylan/chitin deacetylase (PgdA/CDA1 family)